VDEIIHVAKLELDRRPHVIEPHDPRVLAYDFKAAIHVPPVVVGHFKDEEVLKEIAVVHCECTTGER
jgi:hypothetical protein